MSRCYCATVDEIIGLWDKIYNSELKYKEGDCDYYYNDCDYYSCADKESEIDYIRATNEIIHNYCNEKMYA